MTPVKVSSPPVLEDDFLILEDDEAFRISIPSTAATSKRRRRTSSRDKESSADKSAKGSSALKQPQPDQVNATPEPQTVGPKVKKKGSDMIEVTLIGNEGDVPENDPSCEEAQRSSKRKRPREGPFKNSDKAKEHPQTGRRASGGRGKAAEKKETRQEKSKYMKAVTDDSEATIHKSSKVTRKAAQDLVYDDATTAEGNLLTTFTNYCQNASRIKAYASVKSKKNRAENLSALVSCLPSRYSQCCWGSLEVTEASFGCSQCPLLVIILLLLYSIFIFHQQTIKSPWKRS